MLRSSLPLSLLLTLLIPVVSSAQPVAPVPHCASVAANGDVVVTWTVPAWPSGDFGSYEIWHATDIAGPYNLLSTVLVQGQVSYTHVGAGGNTGAQFYYLTSVTNGLPPETSAPSDTIATIFLQVFQSTPLGSANLSWSAPAIAPTAATDFTIWLEHPIGTWTQIASVPSSTFSYQWVVDICEDSLTFRISLGDALGCVSFSNRDGEIFNDVTPPSVPVIEYVTVDSLTGLSNIHWSPSPEPDTDGYIIVWNGPGGGVIIDTIFGQNNTSYEWPLSDPFTGSEGFVIAAFDTCEHGTPPSPNTSATGLVHATIHANLDYDRCSARVRVFWTSYVGWATQAYQVLVQMDGGPWALLGTVAGSTLQFYHDTDPGHNYCYIVKAIEGVGLAESLSNKTCAFTAYPAQPLFNYVRTVTVTGESSILLVDSVDQFAEVQSYTIERSKNGGAYEYMATVPGTAGPLIQWIDTDVRPADTGYLYRVQVQDSCGNPSLTSNVGSNIVLRASSSLTGENNLTWNGYIQWAGLIVSHDIYRSVDDGAYQLIATVPSDPWEYTDDVNAFVTTSGGRFCYYVATHEAGNPSGIDATSTSNIACTAQEDLVYIPNCFIVGSSIHQNGTFKPVLGFVDVDEYQFLIINRWGQVIWETNDPNEGWDGVVGSQVAPIGIYAYYCEVRSGTTQRVINRGTVTLLTARDE